MQTVCLCVGLVLFAIAAHGTHSVCNGHLYADTKLQICVLGFFRFNLQMYWMRSFNFFFAVYVPVNGSLDLFSCQRLQFQPDYLDSRFSFWFYFINLKSLCTFRLLSHIRIEVLYSHNQVLYAEWTDCWLWIVRVEYVSCNGGDGDGGSDDSLLLLLDMRYGVQFCVIRW